MDGRCTGMNIKKEEEKKAEHKVLVEKNFSLRAPFHRNSGSIKGRKKEKLNKESYGIDF